MHRKTASKTSLGARAGSSVREGLVVSRNIGLAIVLAARMVGAPGVIAGQTESARTPRSARELAQRYQSAHAQKNVAAIQRLFFWGGATEQTRAAVRRFIEHDVAHAIRGVAVKPLGVNQATEYTQGGVSYRMTLAPVARIDIEFVPRIVGNAKYKSEQTSYFVGVRGNSYYLVTAEPGALRGPP
jgi:hypothetical protein